MGNEFFENLGKTLSETARTVGEKTDDFIAVQKLRSHQASLENQVRKGYRDIGTIVYQKFVDGEPYCEEIADICGEIMTYQCQIAECKEKIADKKGRVICPACGADAPKEADYCMRCGSPIPKEAKTEEAGFREAAREDAEPEGAAGEEKEEQEEQADAKSAGAAAGACGGRASSGDTCEGHTKCGGSEEAPGQPDAHDAGEESGKSV